MGDQLISLSDTNRALKMKDNMQVMSWETCHDITSHSQGKLSAGTNHSVSAGFKIIFLSFSIFG